MKSRLLQYLFHRNAQGIGYSLAICQVSLQAVADMPDCCYSKSFLIDNHYPLLTKVSQHNYEVCFLAGTRRLPVTGNKRKKSFIVNEKFLELWTHIGGESCIGF